jgi:flagellar protein FlaG
MRVGQSLDGLPSLGSGVRKDGAAGAQDTTVRASAAAESAPQAALARPLMEGAVKKANAALEKKSAAVEFVIDEESKRVIVRLVDRETRKVLRQIPNEEMLRIARFIDEMPGIGVAQKA